MIRIRQETIISNHSIYILKGGWLILKNWQDKNAAMEAYLLL